MGGAWDGLRGGVACICMLRALCCATTVVLECSKGNPWDLFKIGPKQLAFTRAGSLSGFGAHTGFLPPWSLGRPNNVT